MVVLAASLINKSGKALVSRQYVVMSRIRIEALLAAFPKLVGSGKQHTYVETDNVRYVYQPLESLYLILVTNKSSNILEDLETLRLLSKLIPEYCHTMEEESVSSRGFEIVFVFDEVISLGHKEAVTGTQVREYLEMDSSEEKMHKLMMENKTTEVKKIMQQQVNIIEKNKLEKLKNLGSDSSRSSISSVRFDNGYDNGFSSNMPPPPPPPRKTSASSSQQPASVTKGMQLGKGQKANQFIESLKAEGELIVDDVAPSVGSFSAPVTDPIVVCVEEKLKVVLRNDGGLGEFDLQGILSLVVQAKEYAFVRVQIESGANDEFQFKTHPNIDKDLYHRENILALKDPRKPFPTGAPTGIIRWRLTSKDESLVPITINCWPSASKSGESIVNIEYEAHSRFDLRNVTITIPLREVPKVNQIDSGDWRYDSRKSFLEWSFVLIDESNRTGAMEFVVPATDASSFFPIEVNFVAKSSYCDVKVASVLQDGQQVSFGGSTQLLVEKYEVK